MPRRRKLNIPKAVEDGAQLMADFIDRMKAKGNISSFEFWQLDRATERLHQLQRDLEGPIPVRVLKKMSPEDLDTVTSIFARYGL